MLGRAMAGFRDWADVVVYALTLPQAELASFYGELTPKVGGKAFVALGRERDTSFALMTTLAEKDVLLEADPDLFWQTAHYVGWPTVLVRFGRGERAWLEQLIRRAWWDKAPARLRKEFGARP